MELITPRYQEQALKDQIVELGYIIKNDYSTMAMQIRRKKKEEKRIRRKSYCAARAIKRALKGNLGGSVILFCDNVLDEEKEKFPAVFTDEGQAELDLEYGVRAEKETFEQTTKQAAKSPTTKVRETNVLGAK